MRNREDNLKLYDKAVGMSSDFQRKGKTMPYTSSNGYMFSLLNKSGELGIRMSKNDQTDFKSKYESGIFKSYGATMRDYVLIPQSMIDDSSLLLKYLTIGFDYVNSLPPK